MLINSEESPVLEKKETLKIDIKTGKKSDRVRVSAMKTVSAFANGDREGTLLIGVSNDKVVTGIEKDQFNKGANKKLTIGFANGSVLLTLIRRQYNLVLQVVIQDQEASIALRQSWERAVTQSAAQ